MSTSLSAKHVTPQNDLRLHLLRVCTARLHAYRNISPNFAYREVQLAPSEKAAASMARNATVSNDRIRKLVAAGRLPKPGQGPSAGQRANSSFKYYFAARSTDGTTTVTSVQGGDPGYEETAKMVSEAALALLDSTGRGQGASAAPPPPVLACLGAGGVHTTASAFGHGLVERLHRRGIIFEQGLTVNSITP